MQVERHVLDGGQGAIPFGQSINCEHGSVTTTGWTPEAVGGSGPTGTPTLGPFRPSKLDMKHQMRWLLVVAALAVAPTIVQAWEHGPRVERQRLHAELRRGWQDAIRETHRAVAQARREVRRAYWLQRQAMRAACRDARRAALNARRYVGW